MQGNIRVTVWNEFRHEKVKGEKPAERYPEGIHGAIAGYLGKQPGITVRTATLDEPEHGLTEEVLKSTDVMTWWGHVAHHEVSDAIAAKVQARVLEGMGLVVLHSAHLSKPFVKLMGTSCMLNWREADEKSRLWVIEPGHPIVNDLPAYIELPAEEMYGERFDIPQPDEQIFISWWPGGEVFRSGCCWRRGRGKVFYFQPGHETYPTYYNPQVLKVIENAVRWAAPGTGPVLVPGNPAPLEKI